MRTDRAWPRSRLSSFVAVALLAAACGGGGGDAPPSPPDGGVQLEVILREQFPALNYPGTQSSPAMGLPMQAFGITPTNEDDWRTWTYDQVRTAFVAWVQSNPDLQGRTPAAAGLNFEKQFNWLDPRNHASIRHAFTAVHDVLGPQVEVGLYGVPYRLIRGVADVRQYETAPLAAFVTALAPDFVIPVLYLWDDGADWIDRVEERTRLAMDVGSRFGVEARPYCWHRLSDPTSSAASARLLETLDPGLERTLGLQVRILDELGVARAYIWHAEDDPALAAATARVTSP